VKVFFDNCTPPVLAEILDAFIREKGDRARHIRSMSDLGLKPSSPDIAWMDALSLDANDWIVITAVDRIRRNRAELQAWRNAGLKGFVLAKGFQKTPIHQTAATLLWRWPEMMTFIGSAAKGSLFELPIGRSSKFKSLV